MTPSGDIGDLPQESAIEGGLLHEPQALLQLAQDLILLGQGLLQLHHLQGKLVSQRTSIQLGGLEGDSGTRDISTQRGFPGQVSPSACTCPMLGIPFSSCPPGQLLSFSRSPAHRVPPVKPPVTVLVGESLSPCYTTLTMTSSSCSGCLHMAGSCLSMSTPCIVLSSESGARRLMVRWEPSLPRETYFTAGVRSCLAIGAQCLPLLMGFHRDM